MLVMLNCYVLNDEQIYGVGRIILNFDFVLMNQLPATTGTYRASCVASDHAICCLRCVTSATVSFLLTARNYLE